LSEFKKENFSEVVAACTEEIEACEDDSSEYKLEAILLRGTFYLLSGQYDLALNDFNTVINNDQADPKLRSNALTKRASLHMQQQDKDKSFEDFEKAISIDPENSDIYHHRGQVYLLIEELTNAVADFSKATEINPKNPLVYVHKLYSEYRQAVAEQVRIYLKLLFKLKTLSQFLYSSGQYQIIR
jgi:mitochondrial import receptor subunit TOM70